MTAKQRLILFLLWMINIGLLLAICIPTGFHSQIPAVLYRHNPVVFYCVAGILLAGLEMYLYYILKGE